MQIAQLIIAVITHLPDIVWFVNKITGKSKDDIESIKLSIDAAFTKAATGDTSDVEKTISNL